MPRTFRHTAITWGMQSGMDAWAASGYFGLSLQTLLEVYGRHHPDHRRDAAAKKGKARMTVLALDGSRNSVGMKKPDAWRRRVRLVGVE